MSIIFPEFVGRDTQLADIEGQIARQGQTVVVNIAGVGGVGKTTILRKIKDTFEPQSNLLVTGIIDFSQTVHRVQSWILNQIIEIQRNGFPTYQQKMKDIETAEPLTRLYHEREAFDDFIQDYNRIAHDHRIILLFDTVEYMQDTPLLTFIIELVAQLKNTVLILAGRRNDEPALIQQLHANFEANQVLTFRLEGFTEDEAKSYVERAEIPDLAEINEDLQKSIFLLGDGNAIKIALALDWLNRGIPLMPEVTHLEPEDIRNSPELETLRIKFEDALMSGIRQLEEPVDEVILFMAHLNKRFNLKMIEFFFFQGMEDSTTRTEQATELLAQLKDLPFVKYISDDYFVLHDEMARLVETYVWDLIEDPDKTQRRELSREAVKYYQQELDTFPPPQHRTEEQRVAFWSYRVEQMYYRLYADFYSGYGEFEQLFEALVDDQRPELAALAVNFLREFEDETEFSNLLRCFVDGYYNGGVLLSEQKFGEAEKTLVSGEKQLGEVISQIKLPQANILDRRLYERRYIIYHQLGFCYHRMGNWELAIDNYNQALNLALELADELHSQSPQSATDKEKLLMAQIAQTLNNLANIHRLLGNFDVARLLCQTSIFVRKVWDSNNVVASQYVMAMILWEMGATSEAMRYLRAAENSCPPENEIMQARITKHRAYILYRAGLPKQANPLLKETEVVFRNRGDFSELADLLNLRSRIYRDYPDIVPDEDHMVVAEQYTNEAYDIAKRIGNEFRQAECHLTRALHYYHWSDLEDHREKAKEACQMGLALTQDRYYRLWSVYSGLLGDIAFSKKEYTSAFQYYSQQCALATQFKRAIYEHTIDTIGNRLRELGAKDPGTVEYYADPILKFWQEEKKLDIQYPELINEINEIKKAINEGIRLENLNQQYQQAYLQGNWQDAEAICDRILEIPSLYTDENRANIILDKIRTLHRAGNYSKARRLTKVVLQIGTDLEIPGLIGYGNLLLARILWDVTSTAEAAIHLIQADEAFKKSKNEVGLTRVKRNHSYIRHRTGFFQEPMDELIECAQVFRENGLDSELADVWNVMSRIARTDPERPNFNQARRYAEQALQKATVARDSYRIAECHLSMAILARREQKYEEVLQHCDDGFAILSSETRLLRSVYHGIRGGTLFELGKDAVNNPEVRRQYWDQAFEAFILELIEAITCKPVRLMRALDIIYETLIRLPNDEELRKYTQQIKDTWQQKQLGQQFPIVELMCDEAVRYQPYIQSDES